MKDTFTVPYVKNNIYFLNPNMKFPKSPLRYPGGKARAVDQILRFIPSTESTLVSPFLGGGSIEIAVASLGLTVIGYDSFQPLVDFWIELLKNPETLANLVDTYFPLSKDKFYELQKMTFVDQLEDAAVFYVLNRSSFGGSTLSGGMSPGHPRFTKSSIDYLRNFRVPTLSVSYGDFHQTIPEHNNSLLYLDPPYHIANSLYGKNGNTHKDFDHLGLYSLLRKRGRWILSYNDCDEIRKMYKGYRMLVPQWKYSMSINKESRELLIISDDLPSVEVASKILQPGLF
ncbi:MAG: DNA adenine methylase [Bacteroidales bacterium]|jgi:DNA adenine methylase